MKNEFLKKGRLDEYADTSCFGVYIHVPFCVRRCRYCAFFSTTLSKIPEEAYVHGILTEASLRATPFENKRMRSLYLGGGTPSRLSDHALAALLQGLFERFGTSDEVTLECNPEHVTPARAHAWKTMGVTRISLGIQSFDSRMLALFGRGHTVDQAKHAIETIFAESIPEISIDLIYGGHVDGADPIALWQNQLAQARSTGVQHVSCYALTLEPHTPLHTLQTRGQTVLESDDCILQMMQMIPDGLGMQQYEISNYAQTGYFSAHNVSCWAGEAYLGLGAGAHSFWPGNDRFVRRANLGNVQRYIEATSHGQDAPTEFVERLSPQLHLAESLMCAARTRFEWSPERIAERIRADLAPYQPSLAHAVQTGYLKTKHENGISTYQTTPLGVQFNNVLDEILFEAAPED